MESTDAEPQNRIALEREADNRLDVKAILVIFTMMTLGAVLFISGWTFDF